MLRRVCRRTGGTTGQRRSWPWRCWSGSWIGLPQGRVGCRRRRLRDVADLPGGTRPWGCATCWTFRAALRSGPWTRLGPVRNIRGSAAPANPSCGLGSGGPWSSAVMNCRMRLGGSNGGPGKPGAAHLPVQCPAGAGHQEAQARRGCCNVLHAPPCHISLEYHVCFACEPAANPDPTGGVVLAPGSSSGLETQLLPRVQGTATFRCSTRSGYFSAGVLGQ